MLNAFLNWRFLCRVSRRIFLFFLGEIPVLIPFINISSIAMHRQLNYGLPFRFIPFHISINDPTILIFHQKHNGKTIFRVKEKKFKSSYNRHIKKQQQQKTKQKIYKINKHMLCVLKWNTQQYFVIKIYWFMLRPLNSHNLLYSSFIFYYT